VAHRRTNQLHTASGRDFHRAQGGLHDFRPNTGGITKRDSNAQWRLVHKKSPLQKREDAKEDKKLRYWWRID
jgi:hypothetical protein